MSRIEFTLKCQQCGSTKFKAKSPNPGPTATVTCAQCGTTIDLAAERKRHEARAAVEERLRGELH